MIKKIILWVLVVFVLLLITAVSLPFIFKDKILEKIKTEINNNLQAKVNFSSFDLTLISSFPDFTLSLNDLVVTGLADFDGDTLTSIKKLSIGADLMSIINGGTIKINDVVLAEPYINLIVLKNGKANWDISKPSPPSTAGSENSDTFKMNLKHYEIKKGLINYVDASSGMKSALTNLNHEGKGDFTQDIFLLATNTSIETFDFWYGGIRYFTKTNTQLKADLDMNMKLSKYTFNTFELSLNELVLGFEGYVSMPGSDIDLDIKFNARKTEFKNFLSLIPGVYQEGFKDLKSSGKLALVGFVKGKYNDKTMPGFGLTVLIQNGMFQYPSLPASVNNVQLDLHITNADGVPDHTKIDVKKLHAELASEPFDARLTVTTPVSDANLDAYVKGKINLANISKIVPMDKGTNLNGQLDIDLTAKGKMSAIEQKKYDEFNAAGHLVLSQMKYVSEDYKDGIYINAFDLNFNPKSVTLNTCDIKTGKTDLKAKGQLDNLLAYIFKAQTLSGSLQLNSNLMDINDLMGTSSTSVSTAADTSSMTVFEIPDLLNFNLDANINKVLYDDMVFDNLKGQVEVANQFLQMKNLSFQMLDGFIVMKGLYQAKDPKKPYMDLSLDIKNADIQKTVKTFNTVKTLAPVAEKCTGKYGASIILSTSLDQQMNPVLATLNGAGKLTTGQVVLSNFEILNKLADAVKMSQFKQLNLSDINISFHFKDGRVNVDPFDANFAGIKTNIQGSNGFDQTIDYVMNLQIPKAMLGSTVNTAIGGILASANKAAGTSISIPDPVKIKAMIGGTVSKPIIKTGLNEQGGSMVTDLKDKAKEEFDKKKKELEDMARGEADRLKKEVEDKAKAETDKLKKEAEAKVKAETEKLKKEAEQKAKKAAEDQLKNIFKKPK